MRARVAASLCFVLVLALVSSSQAASTRIIGGQVADPADWPAQFALVENGKSAAEGQICGGTLVAPQWVATAGHCVLGAEDTPSVFDVVHGADLRVEEERLGVDQIVIHPSYLRSDSGLDLALLHTTAASSQPPMPVAKSSERSSWLPYKPAATAGWGMLTVSWPVRPMLLHDVGLRFIADNYCAAKRIYGAEFNRKTMLCAGMARGGKDSCFGDSGGPLVSYVSSEPRLVGIVSWGGKGEVGACGSARYPGVYSRIAPALSWIQGTTGYTPER